MRIAVTSQNFRTITGHAGKTRRFLIYEVQGQGSPVEVERLDLPADLSLHEYHGDDHPLFQQGLNALITQGAGQGFVQRMARYGIQVHVTSESDPLCATSLLAAGQPLAPGLPHGHGHDHSQGLDRVEARLPNQPR
jgi:predicted Fe-Mo cluster-binding NifX family protein